MSMQTFKSKLEQPVYTWPVSQAANDILLHPTFIIVTSHWLLPKAFPVTSNYCASRILFPRNFFPINF